MNLLGFDHAVDLIVATEKDLQEHGDNFSLVYYPALREGKAIYVAPNFKPGSPEDWLVRSKSNPVRARIYLSSSIVETT